MIKNGMYKTFWHRLGIPNPIWFEVPVTLSDWDHLFPRFYVAYSGWSCNRHMHLDTDPVAERAVAEQQAAILADEYPDWWVRIEDMGPAPFPERRSGTEFYAHDGRKGFIAIRHRHSAAVQWLNEPLGLNAYALDMMRDSPPEPSPRPVPSGCAADPPLPIGRCAYHAPALIRRRRFRSQGDST